MDNHCQGDSLQGLESQTINSSKTHVQLLQWLHGKQTTTGPVKFYHIIADFFLSTPCAKFGYRPTMYLSNPSPRQS